MLDQVNSGQFLDGLQESGNLPMTIAGPWREPPMQASGIPYGITPLMAAANLGDVAIIQYLVDQIRATANIEELITELKDRAIAGRAPAATAAE